MSTRVIVLNAWHRLKSTVAEASSENGNFCVTTKMPDGSILISAYFSPSRTQSATVIDFPPTELDQQIGGGGL